MGSCLKWVITNLRIEVELHVCYVILSSLRKLVWTPLRHSVVDHISPLCKMIRREDVWQDKVAMATVKLLLNTKKIKHWMRFNICWKRTDNLQNVVPSCVWQSTHRHVRTRNRFPADFMLLIFLNACTDINCGRKLCPCTLTHCVLPQGFPPPHFGIWTTKKAWLW